MRLFLRFLLLIEQFFCRILAYLSDNKDRESTFKLLRTALDDGLRFDSHVDVICMEASRQLNGLIRIKKILTERHGSCYTHILSCRTSITIILCGTIMLCKCKPNEENRKSTGKGTTVLLQAVSSY